MVVETIGNVVINSKGSSLERLNIPRAKYMSLCINCGGPIDDIRLLNRNACERCMGTQNIVKIHSLNDLHKYILSHLLPGLFN